MKIRRDLQKSNESYCIYCVYCSLLILHILPALYVVYAYTPYIAYTAHTALTACLPDAAYTTYILHSWRTQYILHMQLRIMHVLQMSHTTHIAHTTYIARTARFIQCTNAETAHTAYIKKPPCIPHAVYGAYTAHSHILNKSMACNAYASVACTQPRYWGHSCNTGWI
jgi:hypothetical protein